MFDSARRLFSFLCLVAVLFSLSPVAWSAQPDNRNWDNATPAEIHQEMVDQKSRAYTTRQTAEIQATLGAMAQTDYDVLFYDIYIRVNDTTEIIYGRVKMVASATTNGVGTAQVDFFSNMTVDSIVGPSGVLGYSRAGNVVTITLDQTYDTGETFQFDFYYQGHPIEGGFQAFSFDINSFGKKVISSLSEPYYARTWWPCKDRPDDKADSFNIAIEVDTSFYCGSNGTLDSTVAGGANSHTFYWRVRYPMAGYLFSVAIAKYTVWYDKYVYNGIADTMPIIHAVYPEQYTYSLPRYGITPTAIQYLSESWGPYPFLNEKYGHSNFEWGGGMEHQTMTSMYGSGVNPFGFAEPVVVHELAHQWWGDMITCNDWHHIWLNEGFASYGEAEYYLKKSGWASYHSYMVSMTYTDSTRSIYIQDTTNVNSIFGSIVYDKGAWVLHMLRRIVGETGFANTMSAWYNSPYRYKSATTENFRDVVEATTGVNIHDFIQDWIYGKSRPNYNYCFWQEAAPGGGRNVYLIVKQIQTTSPQVFRMPIDFFVDYPSGPDDTLKFYVDARKKLIKFHLPASPTDIILDPANWILTKAKLKIPWDAYIVSVDSDLHVASQFLTYADTLQARGGTGSFGWTQLSGALPTGLTISSLGRITGTTADTGNFVFTVRAKDNGSSLADTATFTLRVNPIALIPGNVDMTDNVDIADLTALIGYLYLGEPKPPVGVTCDVNNDCNLDIGDITDLIAYLYLSGPSLVLGCAP